METRRVVDEGQPAEGPWFDMCPACGGKPHRQIPEDAAMPFEAMVDLENDCPMMDWIRSAPSGFQRIFCARCDGRGTVIV
jgi:hypothetical protein